MKRYLPIFIFNMKLCSLDSFTHYLLSKITFSTVTSWISWISHIFPGHHVSSVCYYFLQEVLTEQNREFIPLQFIVVVYGLVWKRKACLKDWLRLLPNMNCSKICRPTASSSLILQIECGTLYSVGPYSVRTRFPRNLYVSRRW